MPVFVSFLFTLFAVAPLAPLPDAVRLAELQQRRERAMEKIGKNGVLILFAAEERVMANDTDYPYREENNFYYLTGLKQVGAALALTPTGPVVYLPVKARSAEIFTGKVLDAREVTAISGIATVKGVDQLAELWKPAGPLAEAMKREEAQAWIFLPRVADSAEYRQEQKLAMSLAAIGNGITVRNSGPLFRQLREIKTPREQRLIQQAIDISGEGFERVFSMCRPGLHEFDLQAEFDYTYTRRQARFGYPTIVGSGVNGTTLHYNTNGGVLGDGALIVIDAGAEYDQYSADVTRTIPVNGKFSKEQAEIYRLVYAAQQAAIAGVVSGGQVGSIQKKDASSYSGRAAEVLRDGLVRLGLMTDRESDAQLRVWLPHGISHQLGMNVHDLSKPGQELAPGMVVTVEPGLYFRPDALDGLPKNKENDAFAKKVRGAFEKYRGMGVRIEDDVLVTAQGPKVLSSGIPSKLEDVEAAMRNTRN